MVVFIIGGGVDTKVIPAWIHSSLFLIAMVHFASIIRIQHQSFKVNTNIIVAMSQHQT